MSKLVKEHYGGKNYFSFFCPGCGRKHFVTDDIWKVDLDTATLSPSVLVNQGRKNPNHDVCHSFVKNGKIQFLNDCTHKLAGKTVELGDCEADVWEIR
jgi:hypothetical protein